MISKPILLSSALLLASIAAFADTSSAAATPPDTLIEQTAKAMFDTVNSKRVELQAHPQELYDLIGKILLPHFDFDRASRLVLGQYWRTATPEQRKEFEDAFYKYLVHSYADGLLKGNYSERDVEIQPWRGSPSDTQAFIKSKVLRHDGPPVEVDYAMINGPDGWKAFDVTIEGISYVLNYRNQFGPEIEQSGIDALIKRLNDEATKAPAAATAKEAH